MRHPRRRVIAAVLFMVVSLAMLAAACGQVVSSKQATNGAMFHTTAAVALENTVVAATNKCGVSSKAFSHLDASTNPLVVHGVSGATINPTSGLAFLSCMGHTFKSDGPVAYACLLSAVAVSPPIDSTKLRAYVTNVMNCLSTSGDVKASAGASAPPKTVVAASTTRLTEDGSTQFLPLLTSWLTDYQAANPNVLITPGGGGSGIGMADALSGKVSFGGSDAYLPTATPGFENIPIAASATDVFVNVPGLNGQLNLNGAVLAQMYSGRITNWGDPAIKALNPHLNLPAMPIITFRRIDSSGSTQVFTTYMNAQAPTDWASSLTGTSVIWPAVTNAKAETGTSGMLNGCAATPGCIAYIGDSYQTPAYHNHLHIAALANGKGKYVLPWRNNTTKTVVHAAPSMPASGSQSLVNSPAGYPMNAYEYAIVKTAQPNATTAAALRAFLTWAIQNTTVHYLAPVHFVPEPGSVQSLATSMIGQIK